MLSKNDIKYITSLQRKKYRDKLGLFIAEGPKLIQDLLDSNTKLEALYYTTDLFKDHNAALGISASELKKISSQKTPNQALAIFKQKCPVSILNSGLRVALDGIQDPGNLGTIIRLCDWFGVTQLWCSNNTVDCYNPKVVQASMGSLARLDIIYGDLPELINTHSAITFGGFMDGESIYKTTFPKDAVLIMGNEGQGISTELSAQIKNRVAIPKATSSAMESLNVATATAVLLSEFSRATGR